MRKKFNGKESAGSLMIEAMAMLALIAMVTPILYKKAAERTTELKDINADDLLVILIARDHQTLIPNGDTEILEGDLLVLAAKQFENRENIRLDETHIHSSHKWKDKLVKDISLPAKQLIIMIQRNHQSIIPNGTTPILENDILVTIETQDEI